MQIFWSISDKNFNLVRPAVQFFPLKSHIWCKKSYVFESGQNFRIFASPTKGMDTFLFEMSMKRMFTFKNFRNVYWHGTTHSAMPLASCLINFDSNFDVGGTKKIVLQRLSRVSHKTYQYHLQPAFSTLEKASCLSISKVMWILSSHTTPFDTLPTNQCHLPPARSTRWKLATLNELQGRKGKGT